MINCPKCGADNMIGAIFCRTCGEKLNLNELSPEIFDAPPVPAGVKIARMAQRIVILVIVLGIVAFLAGLFWPATLVTTGALDQNALGVAQRKYQALQAPTNRTPNQIPFSADEATAIVNQTLGLPSAGTGNKKPQILSTEFLASGNCKFTLKTLVFGQVPMYTTLIARPSVPSPGTVQFQVLKATIGKLPLVGGLRNQGIAQFTALNVGSVFANAKAHVKDVAVTGGSCTITLKR